MLPEKNNFKTLFHVVWKLVVVISITELFIMLMFSVTGLDVQPYGLAVMDAILLTAIATPVIFFWIIKPFRKQYQNSENYLAYHKFAIDQHAIVASTDVKGNIIDVNDKFCEISGYSREELIGQNHRLLNSGLRDKSYWKNMYATVAQGNIWHDVIRNQTKDGHYYWVDTTIVPFMNSQGKPERYIAIRTDVTEYKNTLTQLQRVNTNLNTLSRTDQLTGIANRRAYDERLEREINSARRTGKPLTLMLIDIDHFKSYNDNYGHDNGDITLKRVAKKIQSTLHRSTDLVCRFGGEEFAVIQEATDEDQALEIAERIRMSIQAMAIDHSHDGKEKVVTVSIGVASLQGNEITEAELFARADKALYTAKQSGRNGCKSFNSLSLLTSEVV